MTRARLESEPARAGAQLPRDRMPQAAVLRLQRAVGNRATARILARQPADDESKRSWTLLYKDVDGGFYDSSGNLRWRRVTMDDQEMREDYVDANIDHATADVNLDTGEYHVIEVHYRNGRRRAFAKTDIPNPSNRWKGRGVTRVPFDSFEKHDDDDLIYPSLNGAPVLSPMLTPNLTSIREQADAKAKELVELRKLAWLTGRFISIFAWYGAVTSPHAPARSPMRFPGGRRRPSLLGATPRPEPASAQSAPGGEPPERPVSMQLGGQKPARRTTVGATAKPKRTGGKLGTVDPESGKGGTQKRTSSREEPDSGKGAAKPKRGEDAAQGRPAAGSQTDQPATPRQAPAERSLLQRAQDAGVAEEIHGPIEVYAVGTTQTSATATVDRQGFSTAGGNFGGRRYAASNIPTARVFALRRVTNAPPGSRPGVVGVAMPRATVQRLKQQQLIRFENMTDPPPELAASPGQWVIEPGAIRTFNDDGFFFLIE